MKKGLWLVKWNQATWNIQYEYFILDSPVMLIENLFMKSALWCPLECLILCIMIRRILVWTVFHTNLMVVCDVPEALSVNDKTTDSVEVFFNTKVHKYILQQVD